MTRFRFLASAAIFGILTLGASTALLAGSALWAGTAFAATSITAPTAPFTVPLNAAMNAPRSFLVSATGFPFNTSVFTIICDGTPGTDPFFDPNVNCDNGTSPAQASADSGGNVTFDPAILGHGIGVFDGESPSGSFNCYYPGEKPGIPNGDPDPINGLPSWTNCQVRVASNNASITADQIFLTFTLPAIGPVTTTTTGATTTTTVAPTTTTNAAVTTTSTLGATTTTTSGGTTTTTTTTTTVGGAGTTTTSSTTTTLGGATSTTASGAAGDLAITGFDINDMILGALALIGFGAIVRSRSRT